MRQIVPVLGKMRQEDLKFKVQDQPRLQETQTINEECDTIWSPKGLCVESWVPSLALVGGIGTFRRRAQWDIFSSFKGVPLKGYWDPGPFKPSLDP
jgi:hypothetical protein